MNYPNINLRNITRDDVKRIVDWIKDDEVAELWFGRYSYGDSAHLGYDPQKMLTSSKEDWIGHLTIKIQNLIEPFFLYMTQKKKII